jgi:hypothetical protein
MHHVNGDFVGLRGGTSGDRPRGVTTPEQARIDLTPAHSSKTFSVQEWRSILDRAAQEWARHRSDGVDADEAWERVVRDFHGHNHWGFGVAPAEGRRPTGPEGPAGAKASSAPRLGYSLIGMLVLTATVTKVAVVWIGQTATSHADEPEYWWIFLAVIALVLANFGFFLWRWRHHQDG